MSSDKSFDQLAASRREWIDTVLRSWCRCAPRRELVRAAAEWTDIAGDVDPKATLWTWAWSRFPVLVHKGLTGIDETRPVLVTLRGGETVAGYPDARGSVNGSLILITRPTGAQEAGPFPIDDIVAVCVFDDVAEV